MKLKAVKIKNYKSYCEQDNLLIVDDINTIIGKNESGKSNLIEAISFINYKGIDNSFFTKYNTNINNEVELSISVESENIPETILTFKKDKQIEIDKGLSNYILNNTNLQDNLKYVLENKKVNFTSNGDIINWYNDILISLGKCDKSIFLYDTNKLNQVNNSLKSKAENKEYVEKLNLCIKCLYDIYNEFPEIIRVTNDELKTTYLRNVVENDKENKVILTHLLKCIGFSIDDIKNFWKLPSPAQKADFDYKLKQKVSDFISEFNLFYGQDEVQLIPTIESTGLYFNIKTNGSSIGIEERSNGLRWYLNLFIQIKSKIGDKKLKNCVIIIDEPGVYLHVDAQKKLKELFEDFIKDDNQIIYTTHSPFMIYSDKLYRSRLIMKDDGGNTHISNKYYDTPHKIKSKAETISPMLNAIGMSMNYHILNNDDKVNIITEGISDYNYIKAYLNQKKNEQKYNILPSAGVSNVNQLVSILIGWNCKFKVILDQDGAGRKEYKKLRKDLLIEEKDIIFTDLSKKPCDSSNNPIENLFSLVDKNKIGINDGDYADEKAAKSLSFLGKVQEGLELLDEETVKNFDSLFEKLLG